MPVTSRPELAGPAYIGLISGTSMDGIDAVIARFGERSVTLDATLNAAYPDELRDRLRAAIDAPDEAGIDEVGELDTWVGECFAECTNELLRRAGMQRSAVTAIGSHGQTLRHRPDCRHRFTMQIGNPAQIAADTGIDTVADFRRADVARGGEGAPLVSPLHRWLFHAPDEERAVLNLGGIANLTVLPATGNSVAGFDTGPGNVLLDAWIRCRRNEAYDDDGRWAASGTVDEALLRRLLDDDYFEAPPPKSTGLEHFNLDWARRFGLDQVPEADVQATFAALTAASVCNALQSWAPGTGRILVCGGGARNSDLLARLQTYSGGLPVESTESAGLHPDWVEAVAFAWLAMRYTLGQPGNLPGVTGARSEAVLGARYPAAAGPLETRTG